MIIDSYSILFKNLIKKYNIAVYSFRNNYFFSKNIKFVLDLLCGFCYNNIINNKLYILSVFNIFIKKYIDFLKYIAIIISVNSSLT